MTKRLSPRIAAVAAVALIIGFGGIAAAFPAHHGPRDGGDFLTAIATLKGQLNLNTSQQTMWDNAVAAGKAARTAGIAGMQGVHAALAAELAKPEPDLAAVAAAADSAHTQNAALRRQARDAWLNLYGTFTPDQKTIVKIALQKRLAHFDKMRETMMQWHKQGG